MSSAILKNAQVALNALLDFALPRHCISCDLVNPQGPFPHICPECAKDLTPMEGARCLVCSEIVGDNGEPDVVGCPYCMNNPPAFGRSMTSVSFSGIERQILLALKFSNGIEYLDDITEFMRQTKGLEEFVLDAIIVPVPLHYSRRFSRAYNQSELISKCLLKAFPKANCIVAPLLKRVKHTKAQSTLDRNSRMKNIKGAFAYQKKIPITHTSRIIVVDDIMTTTATLSECAQTFKQNGFTDIDAYAFARRL